MSCGLRVTLPAMMLENFLVFGFIEAFVTALKFSYIRE
jgi:ABC-type Co2+ transport system permease subunit